MAAKDLRHLVGLFLLFWAVLTTPCPGWAQGSPPSTTYDLSDCIEQALKTNPTMEHARYEVSGAQWELRSAKLERTPRLEMFNVMGIVEDAEGGALDGDTIDDHFGFFNKMELDFALPLYTFGRLSKGIDAASAGVEAQEAAKVKSRNDLVLRIHNLYYGLVLARQILESTREIKDNFTKARDIVEERLEKAEGKVTEIDLLKLKIGLAGVTEGLRKVEREAAVTQEALREAMGLDPSVKFDIADDRLEPVDFELAPLEQYLSQAEGQNPDLQRIKAGLEAKKAKYLSEKSKFYPSFLLVGGVRHAVAPGREEQDNPFLDDNFNFFDVGAAFGVKWDMNFFKTDAEVEKEKVEYLKMKSRLRQGLNGIDVKVKDKYHRVVEKEKNLDTSYEARKSGRALVVLTMTNFEFGIGSGSDLFQSLGVYAETANSYYEAVYDYNMAVAELKTAVGAIAPPKDSEKPVDLQQISNGEIKE